MPNKVLVIAEIGHNGNGNMRLNKLMIEEAKACGADIAKFQLYDTDVIKKPWQSRYMELKMAELTKEDVFELKAHCDKVGIEFMASAFDPIRVAWLEEVGVKRHKLASRSIYDKETIDAMVATGKPIIASLGKWKNPAPNVEGKELIVGNMKYIFPSFKAEFLYCISEYPAYITEEMFPNIFSNKQTGDDKTGGYAGFSDHSLGMYWAREAVKRGATIIEKHFTLDKSLPGFNQKGSCDPTELKDFITYVRQAERGIKY